MAKSENTKPTRKRAAPATAWKPGQSGNPGGRPREIGDVRDIARQHTEAAVKTLIEIAADQKAPQSARVAAATAILDRGYGKPTQPIDAQVTIFDRMTLDEQRSLAAALQSLAGDEAGDTDGTATTH